METKVSSSTTNTATVERVALDATELEIIKTKKGVADKKHGKVKDLYDLTNVYTTVDSETKFERTEIRPVGFFNKYSLERSNKITSDIIPHGAPNFNLYVLSQHHPINQQDTTKTVLRDCEQHCFSKLMKSNYISVLRHIFLEAETHPGVNVLQVKGGRRSDNVAVPLSFESYNILQSSIAKNTNGELDVFITTKINAQEALVKYGLKDDTQGGGTPEEEATKEIEVVFCEVLNELYLYDYVVYYKKQGFKIVGNRKNRRLIAFVLNESVSDSPYGNGIYSSCLYNIIEAQFQKNLRLTNTGKLVHPTYVFTEGTEKNIKETNPNFEDQEGGYITKGFDEGPITTLPQADLTSVLYAQETAEVNEFKGDMLSGNSAFSSRQSNERQNETETRRYITENTRREVVPIMAIVDNLIKPSIFAAIDVLIENEELMPLEYSDEITGVKDNQSDSGVDKTNELEIFEGVVAPAFANHQIDIVTKTPFKLSSVSPQDLITIDQYLKALVEGGGFTILDKKTLAYALGDMAGIPYDLLVTPIELDASLNEAINRRKEQEQALMEQGKAKAGQAAGPTGG